MLAQSFIDLPVVSYEAKKRQQLNPIGWLIGDIVRAYLLYFCVCVYDRITMSSSEQSNFLR